jgi:type IV pilus assembly protein PilA
MDASLDLVRVNASSSHGVIFSGMAESRRKPHGRGFSLIELLVVIAIILVILAVAVPRIKEARLNAVETMVVREVQTIGQAQTQYQSQFNKFAASLAELGPPASGTAGPQAANLIPASLASGEKDGYLFGVVLTPVGYSVNANPEVFGGTGRRTFYLDQDGIVHQNWSGEPASIGSPEFK